MKRKKYQRCDVLSMVNTHNTRFTSCEVQRQLAPARDHISKLIKGLGSYDDWCVVMGVLALAQAIHDRGVIRGITGYIEAARLALNCCGHRAAESGEWKPPALTVDECDSLENLYALYKTQIEQLTFGEYTRAFNLAQARLKSAKVKVVVVESTTP